MHPHDGCARFPSTHSPTPIRGDALPSWSSSRIAALAACIARAFHRLEQHSFPLDPALEV
jgi:hypothetical protein